MTADDHRLHQLQIDYGLTSTIDQLREARIIVVDALSSDIRIGDLTAGDHTEVEHRVFERFCAMASRSDGVNAKALARISPELLRREALLAVQQVVQEADFKRSLELLSVIRGEFQAIINQIDSAFATLEQTGKRLELPAIVGTKRPQRYKPPKTENRLSRLSRLHSLIQKENLSLSAVTLADVESGLRAVLAERFPNSLDADFTPVVEAARDRAIKLLEENGGNWPKVKGSWYVRFIDDLLTERTELFSALLARN